MAVILFGMWWLWRRERLKRRHTEQME